MDEAIRLDWDKANTEQVVLHGVKPEEAEQALENDPFDLNTKSSKPRTAGYPSARPSAGVETRLDPAR
jgi:hypothetical protein